jgi:hypothetical protein
MIHPTNLFDEDLLQLKESLRSLLLRWRSGELDERAVHEQAENLWRGKEWPQYEHDDPRSIIIEVLEQLSILNCQWIIREDIPAILSFLETRPGQQGQAWREWHKYWDTVDWKKRWNKVKGNLYYSQSGPHTTEGQT